MILLKFAYFPGCSLKSDYQNFEKTAIEVLRIFNIELVELPRWNCCGTVFSLSSDNLMNYLAPTRILIRAQELNKQIGSSNTLVTLCSMCYNTIKQTNNVLTADENRDKIDTINAFMDDEVDYEGNVVVKHYLEILRDYVGFDKIAENIKRDLSKLKIAPYYGCLLLRPDVAAVDDPEQPKILSEIIKSVGAEPVEFPLFNECCGAYNTVTNPDLVIEKIYQILTSAKESGADAIITSCPLCFFNLDYRQKYVSQKYSQFSKIPILYFTQLLAIGLGLDLSLCEFNKHFVDPTRLFKERRSE